jgi:prevent-host-death family protein
MTVLEFRADFSRQLKEVSTGRRILLTRRNKEVAALIPVADFGRIETATLRFGAVEEAERWAIDVAASLLRGTYKVGETEKEFSAAWKRLVSGSNAALNWMPHARGKFHDPCEGLFPFALMLMLRKWRQFVVDTQVNALRASLSRSGIRESIFEKIISVREAGSWGVDLIRQLEAYLNPKKENEVLTVAVSAYHEERVLAHLISDLYRYFNNRDGLQIHQAAWSSTRTPYGETEEPDIQLNSLGAEATFQGEDKRVDTAENFIFQHHGYRAYVNGAWLAGLGQDDSTPPEVKRWINELTLRTAQEPDRQHLAARIWVLMKGLSNIYPDTEFVELIPYLEKLFESFGTGYPLPARGKIGSEPDPDLIFERFLKGDAKLFMGGSIHDMLLDEFWIKHNMTFVKVLDKVDLKDWRIKGQEPGRNVLRWSKRLRKLPNFEASQSALREIYKTLARQICQMIGHERSTPSRDALLTYIADELAPDRRQDWNTNLPLQRWSFAASADAIVRLFIEEMTPSGPDRRK